MSPPNSSSKSNSSSISGFCSKTLIYHSLKPPSPLPPKSSYLSVTDFIFSLATTTTTTTATPSLTDATTGHVIRYSDVPLLVRNLSVYLRQPPLSLAQNHVAFIISPNSSYLPILYLSLLSIGVVVSPANPSSSIQEIARLLRICKPAVAFCTSETVNKLLNQEFSNQIVLIDSNEFELIMKLRVELIEIKPKVQVLQSDTAAILYSSGTTGNIKGVKLTHRNLISAIAGAIAGRQARSSPAVYLCTVPYFHSYGFVLCIRMIAFGDSLVSIARFNLSLMVRLIEEFKVTHLAVAPPVVVALVDGNNERLVHGIDWKSLETIFSGGAPIAVPIIDKFKRQFPNVSLLQAYGLTETTGGISRVAGQYESTIVGSVGRLIAHCEAKIVDPNTGVGLPPMKPGELWVRGPSIMKGYVDDKEVIDTTVDSDGWLRTGDLCYFDNEGFLFVVDRLKELIKYKGYQVPPAELEHILHSHPAITEAAVIPYPDEAAGQVPMAYVVRQKGSTIDERQVKEYVAKQVAPYKKLRRVCFIDSIPKNAAGKVLRKNLIKLALSGVTSKL